MKQKNNRKIMGIAAGAGIVLLAALVVVMIVLRSGGDEVYRSIKIVELEGDVYIARKGVGDLEAAQNMNLISGDRVTTAKDAYVVLKLDADKYVMLGEAGAMQVVADGDENSGKTAIRLEAGSVLSEIQNPLSGGSTYEITTPNATMSVRGTVFEVRKDESGNGQISVLVYDGTVAVGIGGKEPALYGAGEYTVFTEGAEPEMIVERAVITEEILDEKVRERLQKINTDGRQLNVGSADLRAEASQGGNMPQETSQPVATAPAVATSIPAVTPASQPTAVPTATPAVTATPVPTATPAPTVAPVPTATPVPTVAPVSTATPVPSVAPTVSPVTTQAPAPDQEPEDEDEEEEEEGEEEEPESTPAPAEEPTPAPTTEPTPAPTAEPTPVPTAEPTPVPTAEPTPVPTAEPTPAPTNKPDDPSQEGEFNLTYLIPYVVVGDEEPEPASIMEPIQYCTGCTNKGVAWKPGDPNIYMTPNAFKLVGLGMTFEGWSDWEGVPWDFEKTVEEDITLYPIWKDRYGNLYKVKLQGTTICYNRKVSDDTVSSGGNS